MKHRSHSKLISKIKVRVNRESKSGRTFFEIKNILKDKYQVYDECIGEVELKFEEGIGFSIVRESLPDITDIWVNKLYYY